MSNFNYLRIANLNYNNNTSKIDDQVFFLNGENTMLNLRNGGGKTVIIQMMMAPFVRRKYRDLNERKFESYFTSKTPTYILVEWNLEDDAGYLLTGMMVRKKEISSDDDSRDKLDIINFVYEYKSRNKYDIKSIPIIEENGNSRKIKSFTNSKNLFEELKKNPNYNFNYYDMNNYGTSKAYFDKLREYGIDNKEWENIIKKVNLTESGLSQLFKEAKNTEGLVKKWFLPTIEEKLNKDDNRINNYRDIIEKYIYQYKINKSDIDRKDKIEIFYGRADEIKESALAFKEKIEEKKRQENKIANYFYKMNDEIKEKDKAIFEIDKKIDENELKIREVNYEKISFDIYSRLDKIKELENNISKNVEIEEEYNKELKKLKREKNILECADAYERYTRASRKLQEVEIKIKVLKDKEKDTAPEIKNLGYSIRKLLLEQYDRISNEKNKYQDEKEDIINRKVQLNKDICSIEESDKNLRFREGELLQAIKSFDIYERNFNESYDEKLQRNIVGYFDDEEKITIGKKIENDKKNANSRKKEVAENITRNYQQLKAKNSEKDSLNTRKVQLTTKIGIIKERICEFNKDIDTRKEIIKYVNLGENKVFNNEEIIKEFNKKIDNFNVDLKELYKAEESINEEIMKLEKGKVVNIPKDFLEALSNNNIDIIYGMDWLKNNQYSKEENNEILRRNPFIPYALIMDKKDLLKLNSTDIELYTSFPIPIIERDNLDDKLLYSNNIVDLEKVKFYVSFNNKLLDEKKLRKLIDSKERKKDDILMKIDEKKEAVNLYINKREFIKNSKVTKKLYESTLIELEKEEKSLKDSEELLRSIRAEIADVEDKIHNYEDEKYKVKERIKYLEKKENEFNKLILQYEEYCNNKEEYQDVFNKKNTNEIKIKENKNELEDIVKRIEDIKEKLHSLEYKISECNNNLKNFEEYKDGIFKDKDLEDLLAEYNVVTKKIYGDLSELEKEKSDAVNEYEKCEKQLINKETEFNLNEDEFRNVIYDFTKVISIERNIDLKENDIKKVGKEISSFEKDKAVEESKIESLKIELKKIVDTDIPKEKDKIFSKNFDEELAKLKVDIETLLQEKNKYKNEKIIIEISKSSLDEYDFPVEEKLDIIIELKDIEDVTKKLKRDYRIINTDIHKLESEVYEIITKIENEDIFKSDALFKDAISGLIRVCKNPINLLKQLDIVLDSYSMIVEKLMHDIEIINKEEENILRNIYEYIISVNEDISKIDENSAITISGKYVKMLKISVVNIEENKELYNLRIKEYIENIRDHCVKLLESNESIKEYIERTINIVKLYDEVISIGNIDVKLYKIEENRQKQITWDEVATNSGGEGFLSAFVILSSLLSYMRKEDKDIFVRKEVSKVLIMDNPFAQTNAEHLLKPLIEVAKKSKTQLICLTGLGGDSIINRFDNIYVLNLVGSKLKSGLKVIKSEHLVGDEEVETMVTSHIKTEEVQMKLF
ncbi:hypothetical protein KQI30_08385 [Clostridium bornimense]|uniref:hypothetical protein n=1 Tax=Clostridium bornimense TaxID=1216932 RepID=UPI001C10CED9|nr:hypothetical protein [Clostridium bornimense]MBU5316286.1 hypothetical protein [Clostridium bornimense]